MARQLTVNIPYTPRPLQRAIHAALETHRFSVLVCHRRFGKTVCFLNHLQRAAVTCRNPRPRFAYIAPTYRQAKTIAWDLDGLTRVVVEGQMSLVRQTATVEIGSRATTSAGDRAAVGRA